MTAQKEVRAVARGVRAALRKGVEYADDECWGLLADSALRLRQAADRLDEIAVRERPSLDPRGER